MIILNSRNNEYGGEVPATEEFIDLFRNEDGTLRDHIYMRGMYDNMTGRVTRMTPARRQSW